MSRLDWLERAGKAFGWMGTVVSGVTAFAALFVALTNRDLARDNLRYQRINASLQFGTNLFRSLDEPNQRYGNACMAWLAGLDDASVARWVTSSALENVDMGTPGALRCLAGLDPAASQAVREQFVSRQVFNRLNAYFLPLQALGSGAFDRNILCDDVKGIVDTKETRDFLARMPPGSEVVNDYRLIVDFHRDKPCG